MENVHPDVLKRLERVEHEVGIPPQKAPVPSSEPPEWLQRVEALEKNQKGLEGRIEALESPATPPVEPLEPEPWVNDPPKSEPKNPKTPAHEPVLYSRLASILVAALASYGVLADGQYPELQEYVAWGLAWLVADSGLSAAVRQLVRPTAKEDRG